MPDHRTPDMSPSARGSDAWLVGAFLVLFGVAVAAAMPAIAGAVRAAIANGADAAQGKADTAQRVVVRARFFAVRMTEPKAPDNHDLLPAPEAVATVVLSEHSIPSSPQDVRARVLERGYRARAPPRL